MPPKKKVEHGPPHYGLSEEEVADLKKSFDFFDRDGGGSVAADEIGNVLKKMAQCPSMGELDQMIKELDKSGDGEVDFDEFLCYMAEKIRNQDPLEDLIAAFAHFDEGKTGKCDTAFIKEMLTEYCDKMTADEADDIIADGDPDGKGWVDYKKFSKMLMEGYR